MIINESIELLEGIPMVYLKPLSALIISDTHLGYEGQMSSSGTLIPSRNLSFIKDMIEYGVMHTSAKRLIITGDLKNTFSDLEYYEKREILELIEFCSSRNLKISMIKGNHDNYLDRIKNMYDIDIIKEYIEEDNFYISHGDELPLIEADTYIIGHEHPSIVIYRQNGSKQKLKSFLWGETYNKKKILVIPAASIFATGTDINDTEKKDLLSPFLREFCDVNELNAICISEGENLNFGKIKYLRGIIV
ncbi:MAG: phosphoesterase [Candidatus Parvarchaeum acidophilus ARMAN-5]|jgi:putative SbcD/Mre11-related phosphoesterase|uniref:Phosphoesterase n=1 Tax=Candidatus Parvarchaeum acidophilus ARMAN-5 TaxID=662762 RepID=D6GUN0_PARA5|nr:MAG: phosphoesterase [Candidatus Parvarchaeum acidophilus ARMAN-5]